MAIRIDDTLRDLISRASIKDNLLTLPPLDPVDYAKVKKVINALGIKWDTRAKGHPLTDATKKEWLALTNKTKDPEAAVTVSTPKQDLGQFFTPQDVAHTMIRMSGFLKGKVKDTLDVLDPSCGSGNLLVAARDELLNKTKALRLHGIEIDPAHYREAGKRLRQSTLKYNMLLSLGDFLEFPSSGSRVYDLILMNPPYLRNTWQKHLCHALTWMKRIGVLVAVVPGGAKFTLPTIDVLRKTGFAVTDSLDLPEDTFASEGTKVRTKILVLKHASNE